MAAAASPAYAAPVPSITFAQGVYGLPSYASTATIFETFENATSGGTQYSPTTPGQRSSTLYGESTAGGFQGVFNGTVPGQAVNPDSDLNKFLSIQSGTYTVNFGSVGVQFFSFVFGSLDVYNSLRINFTDGDSKLLTGKEIIGGTNPADGKNYTDTGRVSFNANAGPSISSVTFGSTDRSFEIDDLAAAAPEPATWALMILGFGLIGTQLRSRRRSTKLSFA